MLNAGQCSASWVHSMLNTQEGQAFQWHSIQQMLFHHLFIIQSPPRPMLPPRILGPMKFRALFTETLTDAHLENSP